MRTVFRWVIACGVAMMLQGAPTVLVNGLPAARITDLTTHGGLIVMGHPTVFPALDLGTLMTLLFGMLGLGAMHSYDKKAGTV